MARAVVVGDVEDQARSTKSSVHTLAKVTSQPQLILASGSPRRQQVLRGLGVVFVPRPVSIDESPFHGEGAEEYVLRLAQSKARAQAASGELVLAADTIVTLDGELLGKPADPDDARKMLERLAGREHEVLTGVAVYDAAHDRQPTGVETSRVQIAPMSPDEIDWYVATGEPLDKAGAYAIQRLGGLFVERVRGNYSNVVGLPLPLTYRLFREIGTDLREFCRAGSPSE